MLEYRFRYIAQADEKKQLLELLRIYYNMIQSKMILSSEIWQSKLNFKKLEEDCFHINTKRKDYARFIHVCLDCGKTIYK